MALPPRKKSKPVGKVEEPDTSPAPEPAAPRFSVDELTGKAMRYDRLRKEIKTSQGQQKEVADELKRAAEKHGEKEGESFILDLPTVKVGKIATVKNKVNQEEALACLDRLGLRERCTQTILDEDALMQAYSEGLISLEEITAFTQEITTFKISVRVKK